MDNTFAKYALNAEEEKTIKKYLEKRDIHSDPKRNDDDFVLMKTINHAINKNKDLYRKVCTMAFCLQKAAKDDPAIQADNIIANLFGIAKSIERQRKLAKGVNRKTAHTPTSEKERWAITRMCSRMNARMDYLSGTVIPENLKMTPIFDYLKITGRSWEDDFQELTGLFLSREEIEKKMEEYISRVLKTIQGHPATYRKELDAYNERIRNRAEEKRKERKENKMKKQEEKLDRRETVMAVSAFHFEEDLRISLQEGKYFETVNASKEDLKKNPALRDGFIVLQTRYNPKKAETTYYYKEGKGKIKCINAQKLSSATVLQFEKAKEVCDKNYKKGEYLAVVFSMKELKVIYDPSQKK